MPDGKRTYTYESGECELTGDCERINTGLIVHGLVADDPDAGDTSYGVGDTLTVTLTARTNRGAYEGGKGFVDSLFSMEPPLGADYSGGWDDGSVFVITVT